MEYKDQLVLKGDLNEVGNTTRMNVKKSYRLGLELVGSYRLNTKIKIAGNITISRNKIDQFTNSLDATTDSSQSKSSTIFQNTDIAYSPSVTGAGTIAFEPFRNLNVVLTGKFVGQQFLDNTENDTRKIKDYSIFDILVNYDIPLHSNNVITLGLMINNFGNRTYASNGYTYGYIYNGREIHENFYYPQAGIHFMGKIAVKF